MSLTADARRNDTAESLAVVDWRSAEVHGPVFASMAEAERSDDLNRRAVYLSGTLPLHEFDAVDSYDPESGMKRCLAVLASVAAELHRCERSCRPIDGYGGQMDLELTLWRFAVKCE